jgi:epoxyqueuosine reductase QueG
MTRPKLAGFRRNLAVAIGNSADEEAASALQQDESAGRGLASPSCDEPMVREHVEWAVER